MSAGDTRYNVAESHPIGSLAWMRNASFTEAGFASGQVRRLQ